MLRVFTILARMRDFAKSHYNDVHTFDAKLNVITAYEGYVSAQWIFKYQM